MTAEQGRRARRRARATDPRAGHHRAASRPDFGDGFAALGSLAYAGARVSAHVVDVQTDVPLLVIDDRIVQPVGAIGSLLLLIEVSARLSAGESGYTLLDRVHQPADTGSPSASRTNPTDQELPGSLWDRLLVPALPVVDLAMLVGATRDAAATNALLRHTTSAAVRRRAESLGLTHTAVLDLIRETRGPDDAPHFAVASAGELAALVAALHRGEVVDPTTSARVLGWLGANRGSSLVAAALGPRAAAGEERRGEERAGEERGDERFRWVSSLGVETGLRAEVGLIFGATRAVAFAVIIQFDPKTPGAQLAAVDALRVVGLDLLEYLAVADG